MLKIIIIDEKYITVVFNNDESEKLQMCCSRCFCSFEAYRFFSIRNFIKHFLGYAESYTFLTLDKLIKRLEENRGSMLKKVNTIISENEINRYDPDVERERFNKMRDDVISIFIERDLNIAECKRVLKLCDSFIDGEIFLNDYSSRKKTEY